MTAPRTRPRSATARRQRADAATASPSSRSRDLVKHFPIRGGAVRRTVGEVHAVCGVSLRPARRGETLGLVGESGCGKSTTGAAVLQLLKADLGHGAASTARELTTLSSGELRPMRRDIQIVFQDPYASLDPRMTVGEIVAEPLQVHGLLGPARRPATGRRAAPLVGLNPEHGNRYPHEFSGGQRQRDRHRPGARARAEGAGARRAGVGARRLDPGRASSTCSRTAGPARPRLPVHRARPVRGPAHLRPGRGDVPGQDRRDRHQRTRSTSAPRTRTRRRCCRPCRCPTRRGAPARGGSCSRATCRAP